MPDDDVKAVGAEVPAQVVQFRVGAQVHKVEGGLGHAGAVQVDDAKAGAVPQELSVVQVGVGKRNADFNFTLLQKKELKLYGSRNALKKDFLALIDLVKSGKIDITKIVTNTYELADGPQAFKDFSEHADTMLKVVIHFADPE